MPVYTETKTYHTKAHMGMIDVTDDFRAAVQNACRNTGMKSGTITGFTTGGVAGLTTLEFEPADSAECSTATRSPNCAANCRSTCGVSPISGTSTMALFPVSSACAIRRR